MKKLLVLLVSMFLPFQSGNRWSDLFSYNNVLAFKESNGKIIAATENGVFYYDTISGEITKLSKANGLHEVKFLHLIIILIPSCINWL
jgi:ligand-binding sensor domain-containing protein